MIETLKEAIAALETKEGRYLRLAYEARRQKESLILVLHSQLAESSELQSAELVQLSLKPQPEPQPEPQPGQLTGSLLASATKRVAEIFRDRNMTSCSLEFIAKQSGLQPEQALQILEAKAGYLWERKSKGNWGKIRANVGTSGGRMLPYKESLPPCELLEKSTSLVHLLSLVFERSGGVSLTLENIIDYLYGDEQEYWFLEQEKKIRQVLRSGLSQRGHTQSNWRSLGKGLYVQR